MNLELVSFKICPYVQRSVITLLYKRAPHRITYIDLAEPPDWFLKISPFGKVPVLKVDESEVLFESAVINEFVDDVTEPRLMPQEPLLRAKNRAWIEFGSAALMDLFGALMTDSEEKYHELKEALTMKYQQPEKVVEPAPFFNGAEPSLIDFAFAPLFTRQELLAKHDLLVPLEATSKLSQWSRELCSMDAVKNSVVPEFDDLMLGFVRTKGGFIASRLPAA